MSGIGFAIGVERLAILAEAEGIFEEYAPELDCYVINLNPEPDYAFTVAEELRNNSFTTEMDYYGRSLKAQFRSSERKNARFVLIIGEDEVKENTVTIKDTCDKDRITLYTIVARGTVGVDKLFQRNVARTQG